MGISNASAVWNGGLKDGTGVMRPANAPEAPFSLATRFEGKKGTNPEEMVGAALAGCFSMALSLGLETAGKKPESIQTSARVHLDKDGDGFSITKIELTTEVKVQGLDEPAFQEIALATKKGCPVSKALAGTDIVLTARLV